MMHFLITIAVSFFGIFAATALLTIYNSIASSGTLATPAERAPRSKWVALVAAGAFAAVASLIFYFVGAGLMNAGLGAIAVVVTLITLSFVTRALR